MKRKFLAIILISLLLLTSCSGNSSTPDSPPAQTNAPQTNAPQTDAPQTDVPETDAPETDAPETDAPETDAPETVAPETTAPETEAPEDKSVSIAGSLENNIYTNECLGFSINLDGWNSASGTELEGFSEMVTDVISKNEVYKEYLESNPTFFITDLSAGYADGLAAINIQFQKQESGLNFLSDEAILDLMFATQKDTMIAAFEEMGFEVKSFEKTMISMLGKEIPGMKSEFSISGIPYYTLQFQKYNIDGYLATITFASYIEDITDTLASLCYPIGGTAPDVTLPDFSLTDTPESTVNDEGLEVGTIDSTVYTNPLAGIKINFDENWTLETVETVDGKFYIQQEDVSEVIFSANSDLDLSNINIGYQKNNEFVADFSAETFVEAILLIKDELITSYETMGMTVSSMEKETVTFLGREIPAIKTVGTIMDIDFFILQIPDVTVKEGYTVTYTLGTYFEDTTVDLLNMIHPLD